MANGIQANSTAIRALSGKKKLVPFQKVLICTFKVLMCILEE